MLNKYMYVFTHMHTLQREFLFLGVVSPIILPFTVWKRIRPVLGLLDSGIVYKASISACEEDCLEPSTRLQGSFCNSLALFEISCSKQKSEGYINGV